MDSLDYSISKYPIEHEVKSGEEDYKVEEKIEYFLRPDKSILKEES